MEVAAALSGHGLETTIVLPESHLLSRLFTPKIAEFYEKFYKGEPLSDITAALICLSPFASSCTPEVRQTCVLILTL